MNTSKIALIGTGAVMLLLGVALVGIHFAGRAEPGKLQLKMQVKPTVRV